MTKGQFGFLIGLRVVVVAYVVFQLFGPSRGENSSTMQTLYTVVLVYFIIRLVLPLIQLGKGERPWTQ